VTAFLIIRATILAILLVTTLIIIIGVSIRRSGLAMDSSGKTIEFAFDNQKIPDQLLQDAAAVAKELFPKNLHEQEDFAKSAIGLVCYCKNKDALLVFNSGGYGRAHFNGSTGWDKILNGMYEILDNLGVKHTAISYNRAISLWSGFANEQGAWFNANKKQVEEQVAKLFLCLRHNHNLRIILCGESNGSYFSYQVFQLLCQSNRVYAVLTGPPPFRRMNKHDMCYITRTNGKEPDTFSYGKIGAIIGRNFKIIIGNGQTIDGGKILNSIGAPGHVYGWEGYPLLQQEIYEFIVKYFENQNK